MIFSTSALPCRAVERFVRDVRFGLLRRARLPSGYSSTTSFGEIIFPLVRLQIDNQPCVAPATGSSNCVFRVISDPPLFSEAYWEKSWRFTNLANGHRVIMPPHVRTTDVILSCLFSPGPAPFDVEVRFRMFQYGAQHEVLLYKTVRFTRPPGACET